MDLKRELHKGLKVPPKDTSSTEPWIYEHAQLVEFVRFICILRVLNWRSSHCRGAYNLRLHSSSFLGFI